MVHTCSTPLARLNSGEMHAVESGPAIEPRFKGVSLSQYPTTEIQNWIDYDAAHYHLIRSFIDGELRRAERPTCFFLDVGLRTR